MKNSTTLAAVALAALVSPAFAQDEIKNYKWTARNASESVDEANRDNSWSTQVTNWVDMASGIPLGRAWVDGSNAFIYNDGALVTSKISLPESVTVNNLNVNADSTYTITGNGTLEGAGDFIKEGSGTFVVGVTNNMKGVTYAKEGVIKMNNITTDAFTDSIVFLNGSIDNGGDAKNYMTLTNKIHVPEGYEGNIYTSRYCYYDCTFSGAGTLNFYSAGERVYFGHKNYGPKIENFEGNINIYKHDKGLGSGSYGMLLRGSSTYNPETEEGITDFSRNKIHLGSGTMIVSESKDYFYEIGELSCADETCEWQGYYKASNPTIYYRVGGLNTDVVFPGRIRQPEKSAGQNYKDQKQVIYKAGTGTYKFTHPNNVFTGGLFVEEGTVLLSEKEGSRGSEGMKGNPVSFYVQPNGTLGGTGRITAGVSVEGRLAPGDKNQIGTLTLGGIYDAESGTVGNEKAPITFYPGSVAEFQIESVDKYDRLVSNNSVALLSEIDGSNPMTIEIRIEHPYEIKDGDEFEIISAASAETTLNYAFNFNVVKPEIPGVEIEIETIIVEKIAADEEAGIEAQEGSFKVIAKAKGNASAINAAKAESKVKIYPVPATDKITIDADVEKVEIIDNSGRIVMVSASNELNISSLNSGIYFVKVYSNDGISVNRIIKK